MEILRTCRTNFDKGEVSDKVLTQKEGVMLECGCLEDCKNRF